MLWHIRIFGSDLKSLGFEDVADRLHVLIEGRVQGIGFRYATYRQALSLGLTGRVSNRHDGSVEAVFDGPKAALDQMLEWCRTGPPYADVRSVRPEWSAGESCYTDFRIGG